MKELDSAFNVIFTVIILILFLSIMFLIAEKQIYKRELIKKNAIYYHQKTGELMIRECKE